MEVVQGVERLTSDLGPVFVVVGVFDGLHLGHAYLLRHLATEAARLGAAPTVITFDHHPDEVLIGNAPPLLMDPEERLQRLAEAGVAVTVVQHFDEQLRQTSYDTFVDHISSRVPLRGFLMTPDAAFGFGRRGTPEALAEMGERDGFEVVVVPPFDLQGRQVRSTEIRELIRSGDLAGAAALLGRPVTLTGTLEDGRLAFELPMAIPPDGRYRGLVDGRAAAVDLRGGVVYLPEVDRSSRVSVELA